MASNIQVGGGGGGSQNQLLLIITAIPIDRINIIGMILLPWLLLLFLLVVKITNNCMNVRGIPDAASALASKVL